MIRVSLLRESENSTQCKYFENQITFCRGTTQENERFKITKTYIHNIIYTYENKALKSIVVKWALPSFHGGSLEIMLTVPLIKVNQVSSMSIKVSR